MIKTNVKSDVCEEITWCRGERVFNHAHKKKRDQNGNVVLLIFIFRIFLCKSLCDILPHAHNSLSLLSLLISPLGVSILHSVLQCLFK